jgi:hypothetical protein
VPHDYVPLKQVHLNTQKRPSTTADNCPVQPKKQKVKDIKRVSMKGPRNRSTRENLNF